jgi:hypothetical protein
MWISISPVSQIRQGLVLLFFLFFCVNLTVQQRDPISNFCRRWGHQSAVVDDKLYIGGGLVTYDGSSGTPQNFSSMQTLLNLSHSSGEIPSK